MPDIAAGARWMVGIQTVLDPERPLAVWSDMASLLNATWRNPVAMLDEETEQWFSRDEMALRFSADSSSFDESVLFRIHAAATHERPEEGSSVWLRTQGLHRCGRPELEMLEVSGEVLPVAAELLESVAGLIVMKGIPDPDVAFEAGMGVTLRLRPWADQAASLSADSIGNTEHRASMAAEPWGLISPRGEPSSADMNLEAVSVRSTPGPPTSSTVSFPGAAHLRERPRGRPDALFRPEACGLASLKPSPKGSP